MQLKCKYTFNEDGIPTQSHRIINDALAVAELGLKITLENWFDKGVISAKAFQHIYIWVTIPNQPRCFYEHG